MKKMKRYEYLTVEFNSVVNMDLNQYGDEGWKLVPLLIKGYSGPSDAPWERNKHIFIFEREMEDA